MQALAEGFDILHSARIEGLEGTLPLADIAEVWRRGSVLESWLLDLTASALSEDPDLRGYTGFVEDSGEGRWTVMAAVEQAVPANVIAASLFARFRSRQDHTFAGEDAFGDAAQVWRPCGACERWLARPRTEIRQFADLEALSEAAAGEFCRIACQAIAERGRVVVTLSGGSTPRRLYELLTTDRYRHRVAWDRVEFFWGDERAVPPDHSDSNYRMARDVLLEPLAIPAAHVHRIEGERNDLDAAALRLRA